MEIEQFKTSERLEQDGVWVPIGEGASLLIARIGNAKYEKYLRKIGRKHLTQIRLTSDPELLKELTVQAMARFVLLGWKGLDENKKPIPYSHKKAEELLTNYHGLFRTVSELANENTLFQEDEQEATEGNSESVSSGA